MITCIKCGEKNSDDTRFCTKCNHKLQSASRGSTEETPPVDSPLESFRHTGIDADSWRDLKRMIEAWAYLLLLGGVAAACYWFEQWWPMYPAVALLGLLIWFRRV